MKLLGLVLLLGLAGCVSAPDGGPVARAVGAAGAPTPAGRIVGWVFVDANGNGALDPGEPLISGATVRATSADGDLATVTAEGWFGFSGVADGAWQVAIGGCAAQAVTVAGGKVTVHVPCAPSVTPSPTATVPVLGTPTPTVPILGTATPSAPSGLTWAPLPGLCGRVCVAGLPASLCWDVCLDTGYRVLRAPQ